MAELLRLLHYLVGQRRWMFLGVCCGVFFLFIAAIWATAHALSPEGERIDLFWGAVVYTKGKPLGSSCPPDPGPSAMPMRIAQVQNLQSMETELRKFREEQRLFGLSPMQTGKPLARMPAGTYGYVSSVSLDPKARRLVSDAVQATGLPLGTAFEVHKGYRNDLSIVAFLSASDTARAFEPAAAPREITLMPRPFDGACDLLIIPEGSLEKASSRTIQLESGKEMVVIDARLGPSGR